MKGLRSKAKWGGQILQKFLGTEKEKAIFHRYKRLFYFTKKNLLKLLKNPVFKWKVLGPVAKSAKKYFYCIRFHRYKRLFYFTKKNLLKLLKNPVFKWKVLGPVAKSAKKYFYCIRCPKKKLSVHLFQTDSARVVEVFLYSNIFDGH